MQDLYMSQCEISVQHSIFCEWHCCAGVVVVVHSLCDAFKDVHVHGHRRDDSMCARFGSHLVADKRDVRHDGGARGCWRAGHARAQGGCAYGGQAGLS